MNRFLTHLFLPCIMLAVFTGFSGCNMRTKEESRKSQTPEILKAEVLAKTPPMGWNSWNGFGKNVSEQLIRETADVFVSSGLKEAGYEYIVIDDYWHGGRDPETGRLFPDPERFPSGMEALADYVHNKGLKLGIYSDAGTMTCGDQPGSYGFEEKDAALFAEWGIDFLKYDYCYCDDYGSDNNDYRMAIDRYRKMGAALLATGRPILYSICEWGPRSPWLWGRDVGGQMWRISYDVGDKWDEPRNEHSQIGILTAIDAMMDLQRFAGPNGWNDPDMLVIGLRNTGNIKGGGCNIIEYQTQMSMWCMLAAPLMIGCDIRNMDGASREILLNKDIIAIDQDTLGKQGFRVFRKDGLEAFKKILSGDRTAIAFLNRNSMDGHISLSYQEMEIDPDFNYEIYDVWEHNEVKQPAGLLAANLKSHECKVFILTKLRGRH